MRGFLLALVLLACASCGGEVVVERYEDGALKLTREIRRDSSGEAIAHGTTTRYRHVEGGTCVNETGPVDLGLVAWWKEYREGKLNGEFTRYYLDGSVQEVVSYRDGKENGPCVRYHPGGAVSVEGAHLDDLRHGKWTIHAEDGTLLYETELDRGTGEWATFEGDMMVHRGRQVEGRWEGSRIRYDAGGEALGVQVYSAGEPVDGPWREWHLNGDVAYEGRIENGLREGPWIYWRGKGSKRAEGEFSAGKQTGRWTYWDAGPEPETFGEYVDGRAEGIWRSRVLRGGVLTVRMKAGERFEGLHTEFHPDGSKKLECGYKDGMPGGRYVLWDENGIKREKGQLDEYTGTTTYHTTDLDGPDRVVIHEQGKKTGPWVFYDETGAKTSAGSFEAGKKTGTWSWFGLDGVITLQCGYKAGVEHGRKVLCRGDGTVQAAGEMQDGLRSGLWTFHDERGMKLEEGRFFEGKRNGHWARYHPNGKLSASGAYEKDRPVGRWERYDEEGRLLDVEERSH